MGSVLLYSGIQMYNVYNRQIEGTCQIIACNRTISLHPASSFDNKVLLPYVYYDIFLSYILLHVPGDYTRSLNYSNVYMDRVCPPLDSIFPCYYHSTETIDATLAITLDGAFSQSVDNDWIYWLNVVILMPMASVILLFSLIALCVPTEALTEPEKCLLGLKEPAV